MNKKHIHVVTFLLLVAGGLNWLVIGLFNVDVVGLLGENLSRIVFVLVGLAAIYELATHKNCCKTCEVNPVRPAPSEL